MKLDRTTYFIHDGFICKSVLGEPTAMNERQVQAQIKQHKDAQAFFARADKAASEKEGALAAELEALVTPK